MNRDRIVTGIIIIGVGVLFLLANLGMFSWWSIGNLFEFWPLILVVIGVNIMFKKNTIVSVLSWVLFFGAIIGFSLYSSNGDTAIARQGIRNIDIIKHQETTNADLKLTLGGVRLDIASTDSQLFEASYSDRQFISKEDHKNGNEKVYISVEPIRHDRFIKSKSDAGFFDAKLHEDVIWDIDASIGAVTGNLDFRGLYIEDLNLNIGAGNVDLYLGDKSAESTVDIDAGASKLEIHVKEESGVKIRITGLLSKNNFSELGWVKDGDHYYSPNYEEADTKINFEISAGVGKVDFVVDQNE